MSRYGLLLLFVLCVGNKPIIAQETVGMQCGYDGFETRNGKLVRVNLARNFNKGSVLELLKLQGLEQIYMSLHAFSLLDIDQFPKSFPDLQEVQVRRFQEKSTQPILPSRFFQLLALPHLQKVTIERLQFDTDKLNSVPFAKSHVKKLDASIILNNKLKPVLDRVQLSSLRLQYLRPGRSINAGDLQAINKQTNLETLSLVGYTGAQINPIDISKMDSLHRLSELSLCNLSFDAADLKVFPKLKVLRIRRCHLDSSSFEELFHHPSLETVEVTECNHKALGITEPLGSVATNLKQIKLSLISVADLESFANCSCELQVTLGSHLRTRDSEMFRPSRDSMTQRLTENDLKIIKKCSNLTEFSFLGRSNDTTADVIAELAMMPSLVSLVIDSSSVKKMEKPMTDELRTSKLSRTTLFTYPALEPAFIRKFVSGNTVSISVNRHTGGKISEEFWNCIAQSSSPDIQSLHLSDCGIENGYLNLPDKFELPSLESLTIDLCFMQMDSLKTLLKRCPKIESLSIDSVVAIGEVDYSRLNEFKTLKMIELLNHKVNVGDAQKLAAERVRIGGRQMFSWR